MINLTFFHSFIQLVEKHKNISLFFHELPDMDALGSVYALKFFLNNKYPKKNVKIVGLKQLNQEYSKNNFFPFTDQPSKTFITHSLGIILDTANSNRVWTQLHHHCLKLCLIDHHPKIESFTHKCWVDHSYSSTCQMVGELLFKWDKKYITTKVANYLYIGIISDTNRLLYPSTSLSTYELITKLVKIGCEKEKIHNLMYIKDLNKLLFESYIIKKTHFNQKLGLAWVKLKKKCFKQYKMKIQTSMIYVLNNIENIKIWLVFYYDNNLKKWKGSIRSKNLPINQIAMKYHGGGHCLASGFTIKKHKEFKQIIKDLKNYLKEKN